MYGLNAVALILFGSVHWVAGGICRGPDRTRELILKAVALVLLLGNCLLYSLPLLKGVAIQLPVEFSAVAYFVVPAFILMGRKRKSCWPVYAGLMAGFFYFLALIVRGGPLYAAFAPWQIYISMLNHASLYFLGLIAIGTKLYGPSDRIKLGGGILCVATWALLIRPWIQEPGKLLIYQLLEAPFIRSSLPELPYWLAFPAYYAILALMTGLSIQLFFQVNRWRYSQTSRRRMDLA